MSFPSVLRAQDKQPINAVIIGVGGRGGGAGGNFLEAGQGRGRGRQDRRRGGHLPGRGQEAAPSTSACRTDKCFSGFDGYKKALEVPGVNYAILATPPGFRAPHFKAASKPASTCSWRSRWRWTARAAGSCMPRAKLAKQKSLKVAAGTQRRHQAGYIETIKRIQDGAIGDIVTLRAYWVNGGPIWHRGDKGNTDWNGRSATGTTTSGSAATISASSTSTTSTSATGS